MILLSMCISASHVPSVTRSRLVFVMPVILIAVFRLISIPRFRLDLQIIEMSAPVSIRNLVYSYGWPTEHFSLRINGLWYVLVIVLSIPILVLDGVSGRSCRMPRPDTGFLDLYYSVARGFVLGEACLCLRNNFSGCDPVYRIDDK